jgi:hypothetical protein
MMTATEGLVSMTDTRGLSKDEWDVLLAVPFAVFFLVAYADGRLAAAERRAFAAIVDDIATHADRPQDGLVREVMGQISGDPGQIMDRLDGQMGASLPFYEVLSAARSVLDGMAEVDESQAFRQAMIDLAEEVAQAWPILGRRTSVEEQRSIDFVRDRLGLPGVGGSR